MEDFHSVRELVEEAEARGTTIAEVILEFQMATYGETREVVVQRMRDNLTVMRESVERGLKQNERSRSGLVGGNANKIREALAKGTRRDGGVLITGGPAVRAAMRAMAVNEVNACMGRIVAAPTAGASGTLPGVLLTVAEEVGASDEDIVMALFAASAVGIVIMEKASISGAAGGCQAETGSAAAMAAVAGVQLAGGTPRQAAHAGAIALQNMLGLVCDPVAGLVEIPCVKRNAGASGQAMLAIDLVLAGVENVIPFDEVIVAMGQIGRAMHESLRETAQGGLATTPTAKAIVRRLQTELPKFVEEY
ncbi:MAG: L-serine ammonia-lyase, iron-sulfur-dependent, subunit alpha [Symbiobacteriia bacterium]